MIVEIKLKRDNGDLIFKITANALSYVVAPFPDPIIEEGDTRKLFEFRYLPVLGYGNDTTQSLIGEKW